MSGLLIRQVHFPYEIFSTIDGTIPYLSNGSTHQVLTVPSDRIFVLTTLISSGTYCTLQVDGVDKRNKNLFYPGNYNGGRANAFLNGNAHLVIQAGEVLELKATGSDCDVYHLEGYYAHAP